MRKTEELADGANVFAAMVYWDPTHKYHRIAARLPEGATLPDLNRLVRIGLHVDVARSLWRDIANHKDKVSEALAGRLPQPSVQPKKKRVTSRRRTNATGASRRAGKTQQIKRPLGRSARTHPTTASETTDNDVYTFRGDREGAPDAEATNGGGSSSDGRSASLPSPPSHISVIQNAQASVSFF